MHPGLRAQAVVADKAAFFGAPKDPNNPSNAHPNPNPNPNPDPDPNPNPSPKPSPDPNQGAPKDPNNPSARTGICGVPPGEAQLRRWASSPSTRAPPPNRWI